MFFGTAFHHSKQNCMLKARLLVMSFLGLHGVTAPLVELTSGPGMLLFNWMPICQWQAGLACKYVGRSVLERMRRTVTTLQLARGCLRLPSVGNARGRERQG